MSNTLNELSIGYLTGSCKVEKNHLSYDDLTQREPFSIRESFFRPYESREEFIYCARHTFVPIAIIGLALLDPLMLIALPACIVGASLTCMTLGGLNILCGNNSTLSFIFVGIAKNLIIDLCQALIDLVVLPLSALAMVTRGISTGLQAAGFTKEQEEVSSSVSLV